MRGADDVFQREQRAVGGRFGFEHVQRGAGDVFRFDGVSQRNLVHQTAAGAVDDAHTRLGLRQRLPRQDVAGRVGQRRVQRNDVGARQQRVQLRLLHAKIERPLLRQIRIISQHLHVQPNCSVCNDRADIAATDQPQGLAGELDPHETVLLPLAGFGGCRGLGDLAGEREHHCDGMFCGGNGVAVRRVHHHHTARRRRPHIHIIHPDPRSAYHFQVGRGVEQFAGDLGGGPDRQAIIIGNDRPQVGRRKAGLEIDLDAAAAEDIDGGRGQLVADQNFGHFAGLSGGRYSAALAGAKAVATSP